VPASKQHRGWQQRPENGREALTAGDDSLLFTSPVRGEDTKLCVSRSSVPTFLIRM